MKPERIRAEVARHLMRRTTFALLAAYAAVAGFLAFMAVDDPGWVLFFMHLGLPLGLAPLGALAATRDRERGAAPVLATTPLTPAEGFTAKALYLALILVVGLGLSALLMVVMFSTSGDQALQHESRSLLQGLVVGAAAGALGLLAGALTNGRTVPALSVSFVGVFVWLLLARMSLAIVDLADSSAEEARILALLHVSPVLWAHNLGSTLHGVTFASGPPNPLWGAALLAAVLLGLAAVVTLRLQHVTEWVRPLRQRTGALAMVALLLTGAGGALATWDYDTSDERAPEPRHGSTSDQPVEALSLWFVNETSPRDGAWLRDGARTTMVAYLDSTRPHTLNVTALRAEAAGADLALLTPLPTTISLRDIEYDDHRGYLHANFSIDLHHVRDGSVPVRVHATLDGENVTFLGDLLARPPAPSHAGLMAAAGLPAVGLVVAAWVVPARLNRR